MLDSQTKISADGGGLTMSGNWYIGTSGLGSGGSTPGTLNGPLNGTATYAGALNPGAAINGYTFTGTTGFSIKTGDIAEGNGLGSSSNLWFTNARVYSAIPAPTVAAASGGGNLTYNNGTGVFTFTPPNLSGYALASSLAAVATSGNYIDLSNKPVTGVSSVNGQTGAVTVSVPVTSVNGQTGDVTISASQRLVYSGVLHIGGNVHHYWEILFEGGESGAREFVAPTSFHLVTSMNDYWTIAGGGYGYYNNAYGFNIYVSNAAYHTILDVPFAFSGYPIVNNANVNIYVDVNTAVTALNYLGNSGSYFP